MTFAEFLDIAWKAGLFLGAVLVAVSTLRQTQRHSGAAAIQERDETIRFLRAKNEDKNRELMDVRQELGSLRQRAEQAEGDRDEYRQLVMLEKVPTVLADLMAQLHMTTLDRIDASEKHMVEALASMAGAFSSTLDDYLRRNGNGGELKDGN